MLAPPDGRAGRRRGVSYEEAPMAQDEFDRSFYADEPDYAAQLWDFAGDYASYRPGDPRARIVSPDGEASIELTPALADLISTVGYLMSRGHAVAVESVGGTMSIEAIADLVLQRPDDVREAIRNGLVDVADPDVDGLPVREALLYRNHVRASRRLGLNEIHGPGDDSPDERSSPQAGPIPR